MARTNTSDVADVLDTSIATSDLTPWIEAANAIVDRIADEDSSISTSTLTKIEKFYAAYLATAKDPRVSSRSGDSRSESYRDTDGDGNASFKEVAVALDTTGIIAQSDLPSASIDVPDAKGIDD